MSKQLSKESQNEYNEAFGKCAKIFCGGSVSFHLKDSEVVGLIMTAALEAKANFIEVRPFYDGYNCSVCIPDKKSDQLETIQIPLQEYIAYLTKDWKANKDIFASRPICNYCSCTKECWERWNDRKTIYICYDCVKEYALRKIQIPILKEK